jgi:hypothetical protein
MMNAFNALARRMAAAALAVAVGGCSTDSSSPMSSMPRREVSGKVTLNGQPLAVGKIQFVPVDPGTDKSPRLPASGAIKDGTFTIPQEEGPVPGKYHVSISSQPALEVTPDKEPGSLSKPAPEKVPDKYNRKTGLEADIKDGENALTFDLVKK